MDKRTTNMIITAATALIFGCCSILCCIIGFGTVTGNGTYELGGQTTELPATYGYVFLCLSLIFIIIPIAVGFFMLRQKPAILEDKESVPPAS